MNIAIVGAGKLGIKITEMLLGGDHSVTLIDKDEDVLHKLSTSFDVMTVTGNAKQITILKEIDIDSFDYLLAVTDRDEKNIVIASFAKKLGCSKVIARIRDPEHLSQFDFIKSTMNIDYLINPDWAISQEIYKYLVEKYTLSNGIFSTGHISLLEFLAEKVPKIIDKPISEIPNILEKVMVIAISRNGKIIIPHGNTVVHEDDTLYIMGDKKHINHLSKKVHEKGKYTDLHNVMIAGGGKTGLYLAKMLSEYGASVKIIESDKNRCLYLSSHLNDVLILHGDATDLNLLDEENLDGMDAFVTATGYDEENLLLALMAKQKGVEDVIAKVSRDSYADLIENIGIDMVLNPIDISASYTLRYIQGSKLIVSSQLIQGQAEMIEILADEDMFLVERPIGDLNLPEDVIIAIIQRGHTTIIPTEETRILEGDRVIILCLLSEVADLEKLLRIRKGLFQFQ